MMGPPINFSSVCQLTQGCGHSIYNVMMARVAMG